MGVDPSKPSTKTAERERAASLVASLQEVTDGVVTLAKHHVDLAKAEARQDVKAYGKEVTVAAVGGVVAFLGYALLNLCGVLVAWWQGGAAWGAAVAGALAIVHIVVGGSVARGAARRMKEREAMRATTSEMQRSSKWVKELRDSSSEPANEAS